MWIYGIIIGSLLVLLLMVDFYFVFRSMSISLKRIADFLCDDVEEEEEAEEEEVEKEAEVEKVDEEPEMDVPSFIKAEEK